MLASKAQSYFIFCKRALIGILACSICLPLLAGQFTVSPVRIYMDPADRAIAITITNDGDQPIVMQADLYTWSQSPDGVEQLELSEDMFLSPPIIRLEANSRQVVRLARLSNARPTEQLTYRMIVREIPEALTPDEGAQVQIALALSLPIFITPRNVFKSLDCRLESSALQTGQIACENLGSAYAQPREIIVNDSNGDTLLTLSPSAYILPGSILRYNLPDDIKIPEGAGSLILKLDDNSRLVFDINNLE